MPQLGESDIILRIERIAERCSGISNDLKALNQILGDQSASDELLIKCATYAGRVAERFESLAGTLERLKLAS